MVAVMISPRPMSVTCHSLEERSQQRWRWEQLMYLANHIYQISYVSRRGLERPSQVEEGRKV